MKRARTRKAEEHSRDLAGSYASELEEYLAAGGEGVLRRGYELGRRAIAHGTGVVELATIHQEALARLLLRSRPPRALEATLRRAEEFFAESLSPYEMALRGFRESLSGLRHLNETMEREIQRIAQAVHDEAGQLLFAARLAMSGLAQDLEPGLRQRLEEVGAILDRAEKELRRLSHDLRPTILEDLGLMPALRMLADGNSRRARLSINVESFLEERLPANLEATVYRLVQEALTNVTRHSEAQNVRIRITRDERGMLRCVVDDDGKGFDVTAVLGGRRPKGLGLTGMRERLGAVGGALQIDSAPGRGTELTMTIPLEVSDADSRPSRG